jgi:hypothetical protein
MNFKIKESPFIIIIIEILFQKSLLVILYKIGKRFGKNGTKTNSIK